MLDVLLRGGTVVDGTGAPSVTADVGIRRGRVVAVGEIAEPAERIVDVAGQVVCPGFIDLHTHYDAQLLWDPTASPSVLHGVTTVFGGNCGFSVAPLGTDDADYIQRMMAVVEGIPLEALEGAGPWDWHSFAEYLDRVDTGLSVNAGFLVGHSTVRRVVMGEDATRHEASPGQMAAMARLVGESVAGGALGFSSSLGEGHLDGDHRPVPSSSASHGGVRGAGRRATRSPRDHPGVHPDGRSHPRGADAAHGRDVLGRRSAAQLEPAGQPGLRRDLRAAVGGVGPGRGGRGPCGGPDPARHDADAGLHPAARLARLA